MIPPEIKKMLVDKEARKMVNQLSWNDIRILFDRLTEADQQQILKTIKQTNNKFIRLKIAGLIIPKAKEKIDAYISNDSFPAEYVIKLLKGNNRVS